MHSQELFDLSRDLFPGGVNSPVRFYQPFPRFMQRGKGSRIFDIDGNEYIDYCLGFGPMILGHADENVITAIKEQSSDGSLFGAPTLRELDLGDTIRSAIPSIESMRFTNSGTEATMHVLRLARYFTGRDLLVKISGGFHGSHDMSLDTDNNFDGSAKNVTIEVPYNDSEAIESVFKRYGKRIAALIMEPVLGNIGVVPPKIEFLREARSVTQQYDSLLIFDEVITGFRFHFGGYQDIVNIKPDLTTLGKIIGGGLPVGLFGGRKDIMSKVAPEGKFYQQGTFSANPLVMAAGIATLDKLRHMDYGRLGKYTSSLVEHIRKIFRDSGIDATVNSVGSMFTVFFTKKEVIDNQGAQLSDGTMYGKFFDSLLKNGIFIPGSKLESCFVSFSHTDKDLERTKKILDQIPEEMVS
jgi:glutamate-1-semialdehyde 2,1-aminomutase